MHISNTQDQQATLNFFLPHIWNRRSRLVESRNVSHLTGVSERSLVSLDFVYGKKYHINKLLACILPTRQISVHSPYGFRWPLIIPRSCFDIKDQSQRYSFLGTNLLVHSTRTGVWLCTKWWSCWLFLRLRGFGENVRPFIPLLCFHFLLFTFF